MQTMLSKSKITENPTYVFKSIPFYDFLIFFYIKYVFSVLTIKTRIC